MGEMESRNKRSGVQEMNVGQKIVTLQKNVELLDRQIECKRQCIKDFGSKGQRQKALDETESLRILMTQRQAKTDSLKLLTKNLNQLNLATDIVETQKCVKQITQQKFQLISELDPLDIKDTNIDSRVADKELEKILSYAGVTEESRESDQRMNESLFEELMRETQPSPTTTTTTTTTTTIPVTVPRNTRDEMTYDLLRF
jgi:hypothetical protein